MLNYYGSRGEDDAVVADARTSMGRHFSVSSGTSFSVYFRVSLRPSTAYGGMVARATAVEEQFGPPKLPYSPLPTATSSSSSQMANDSIVCRAGASRGLKYHVYRS
jgi:hypothetical protein